MKFGLILPNFGVIASGDAIRQSAALAEDLGFDSVWTTDHALMPAELVESLAELRARGGDREVAVSLPSNIELLAPGRRPGATKRPVTRRRVLPPKSPASSAPTRRRAWNLQSCGFSMKAGQSWKAESDYSPPR